MRQQQFNQFFVRPGYSDKKWRGARPCCGVYISPARQKQFCDFLPPRLSGREQWICSILVGGADETSIGRQKFPCCFNVSCAGRFENQPCRLRNTIGSNQISHYVGAVLGIGWSSCIVVPGNTGAVLQEHNHYSGVTCISSHVQEPAIPLVDVCVVLHVPTIARRSDCPHDVLHRSEYGWAPDSEPNSSPAPEATQPQMRCRPEPPAEQVTGLVGFDD